MTHTYTLLRSLRHLIVDLDGVLYRGREAIPGADEFIAFLRRRGIGFVLATNNSTRTPDQYVARLAQMGIHITPDELLTSAQATAAYLSGIAPAGTRVFTVGMDGLRQALTEAGFCLAEDDVEYVVAGMDFTICFERLADAALHLRAGAKFIGTNPDRTFPSERGIIPGAGSLLAFLETASGVAPIVIGKPGTGMLEQAMARLSGACRDTAMLGDRLETDILAGRQVGMHTLLVLSGVTDAAALAASDLQPDLVFQDVAHLRQVWQDVLDG